ncbi:MAG: YbaN family protein [Lachnospiraceae bacterium]
MHIKKLLYTMLGFIGLVLGAVGSVLPLIPTFPFLLLAAFFFGKSSYRLHNWFVHTNLYKNNLESYVRGQGMTWRTKVHIMLLVTLALCVGFIMMHTIPALRMVLAIVWICHILFFTFRVKTIPNNK